VRREIIIVIIINTRAAAKQGKAICDAEIVCIIYESERVSASKRASERAGEGIMRTVRSGIKINSLCCALFDAHKK